MQVIFLHDQPTAELAIYLMGNVNKAYPKAQCLAMPLNVPQSADVCSWLNVPQTPQIVVRSGETTTAVLPMVDDLDLAAAIKGSF